MFNLTKKFDKDFDFVYKIDEITNLSNFFNLTFMTTSILNLYAIPYNSAVKILHVTHLYYIEDHSMIFALFIALANQIT